MWLLVPTKLFLLNKLYAKYVMLIRNVHVVSKMYMCNLCEKKKYLNSIFAQIFLKHSVSGDGENQCKIHID